MGNLNQFFRDLGRNAYGLGENVASLGSAAIAEPVAGFAAMYDPANGAQAIREGMTYQPRSEAGKMYQQGAANTLGAMVKPAMPVINSWQKGVDIAGRYSPATGAALQTVPTALGALLGYKPAMQTGRQVSNSLGAMQARMVANANAPRTLNTGFRGQRGVFAGINALTADKEALAKAQQMIAQGVDPAQVWKETGWGKGVDGKWRFEIDDSKAKLRDYQFTPTEAYNNARRDAFVSGDNAMTSRAKSMEQYASMTKNQLKDEYKRTGNEIVDAAINGDIEKAKWLSEQRSGLDALLSQMGSREYGKASSFIAHGDLGEAYPDVYKIHTRISPEEVGNARGHYSRGNDLQSERVVLGEKPIFDSHKSTMLHELQHAIQQREGFAKGGSPQTVNQSIFRENQAKYFDDLITQLEEKLPKPNQQWIDDIHDPIEAQIEKIKEQKYNLSNSNVGFDAYRSLAGEVEARTTQSRLNLDPQQRRENYPFDYKTYGYDVPAKSQTVDFGNNKAMSQRPLTEFEQAHLTAQRNAALPVEKGGLGLPANNTAMDRARAMGYDVDNPVYHGTNWDIEAFDPKKSLDVKGVHVGQQHQANHFSKGVGGANYPLLIKKQRIMEDMPDSFLNPDRLYEDFAREVQYNELTKNSYHGDLLSKAKKADEAAGFKTRDDGVIPKEKAYFRELNRILKENDIDSISYENEKEFLRNHDNTSYLIPDVRKVRSVNAAFDPKKAKSSNLLAQSAKFAPAATLGALMANEKRKDKRN